jgi:predicted dehydrogenase
MKRRNFITTAAGAAAGTPLLTSPVGAAVAGNTKKKIVLVGTGSRGTSFWGKRVVDNYSDLVTFAGLCDINPGRLELAKKCMGVDCPVYIDFEKMMAETKPDLVW